MKPLIALLILGSIATSASAGTHIRGLVDNQTDHTVISEQKSTTSRPSISGSFSRYRDFGRGAAGFGDWR